MKTRTFTIQFQTPAFLGDANQSGRWRTPPFKAQLRQWWRVAFAEQRRFSVNVGEMRDIEGRLFGYAGLDNDKDDSDHKVSARRSEVRIRLSQWSEGKQTPWPGPDPRVQHPNVHGPDGKPKPVGAQLYMGFGPLKYDRETALKANAAIAANEQAEFSIAFPPVHAPALEHALALMHRYGTVGGRSRNGWGSYSLTPTDGIAMQSGTTAGRDLGQCLSVDWPHAVGADSKGALVWHTRQPHKDWAALMKTLAEIKIALRTQFDFRTGNNAPAPEDRHWLSYPVTNHSVTSWGKDARMPNQLRFKVRPAGQGQLVGVIFHMPHLPPQAFKPDPHTLERIWRQVHQHLDQTPTLHRITA